jgi:L-lysine 2,3-aminomutase
MCALMMSPKHIQERERRHDRQISVYSYLLEHPCVDCGESDPVVLEFDHVRGKKRFAVTRALMAGYGWKTILSEIEKCQVRCRNCHRKKTAKEQNWTRYKLNQDVQKGG